MSYLDNGPGLEREVLQPRDPRQPLVVIAVVIAALLYSSHCFAVIVAERREAALQQMSDDEARYTFEHEFLTRTPGP